MLTFVGFGHSHIVALAKGAYALQVNQMSVCGEPATGSFHYLYDEAYVPEVEVGPGGAALHPKIMQLLETSDPRFVVLSIGGNEHNVLSIAQAQKKFDFILGSAPELALEGGAEIIPEAVLQETLRDWIGIKITTMRAIRAATTVPVIQVEPPPPLPREQVLAYPKEFFQKALGLRKVSSDLVRYKMWRLQTELYRDICSELDIAYVATLPEFINKQGMLAQVAWAKDATHANEQFGERMMQEVFLRAQHLLSEKVAP